VLGKLRRRLLHLGDQYGEPSHIIGRQVIPLAVRSLRRQPAVQGAL